MILKTVFVGGLVLAILLFFKTQTRRNRTSNGYENGQKYRPPPDSSEFFNYPSEKDTSTESQFRIVLSKKANSSTTSTSTTEVSEYYNDVYSDDSENSQNLTNRFLNQNQTSLLKILNENVTSIDAQSFSSTPKSSTSDQNQYLTNNATENPSSSSTTVSPVWSQQKTTSKLRTTTIPSFRNVETIIESQFASQGLTPGRTRKKPLSFLNEVITERINQSNTTEAFVSMNQSESVTESQDYNSDLTYLPPPPSASLSLPVSKVKNSGDTNSTISQPSKLYLPPRQAKVNE